ncbi:D-amino acid dehydrogenase [Rhizomicrobium electricum]|uniref:D-amino acid dehydrogenase n=1 Tax=Rhizomicrobium electricum TaxID=480070 RepID=A0ABN1EEG4_9PROT|nr:D-amino-acid dehydrogenase [Rhizomicrobium electricum]
MKVVVLGAGVVGTAAAWFLSRRGHEVTVIEREPAAGLETSFANGGQVSPCHAEPWANPGTPKQALKWMFRADAPLVFKWWRYDPTLWAWLVRFLANCTPGRTRINTDRTLRVAIYSRACLQALRAETGIAYDEKTLGILHVYRNPKTFEHAQGASALMASLGLKRDVKTVAEAVAIEPALKTVANELAGAIFTPDDESGDAHKFTQRLAGLAEKNGVLFCFNTTVTGFKRDGDRIEAVVTDRGDVKGDAYLMAMGSWSTPWARQLGLHLPVYPAKGYSATLPVTDPAKAPSVSITDDEHKMVYSRLGDRLRCAGTAELAGWNDAMTPVRSQAIVKNAKALFPGAGDFDSAELWCGLRPTTPDSVPLLGKTPLKNFYLDTGHGTLGWTMSCGSGKAVADLISGVEPEIDMTGLGIERF